MRIKTHVLLVAAALISTATLAFAERGQGAGRGMRPGGGNYDPATEVTLAGTVDEVTPVPAPASRMRLPFTGPSKEMIQVKSSR